jgi:acyl-CoA synthetase (AMP-forming)/AMP-acid ligase II
MKPQVVVQQVMDATVLKETSHRTPTVQGHQLVDLLKAATVPVAPAVVAALPVMVMLVVEAAAVGAPHTELEGEPVAVVIAEAEATQIVTSPVAHAAAMMPAAELKNYDARSPSRQTTTTVSLPSLLDFAICSSERNSNLWGSPSTM